MFKCLCNVDHDAPQGGFPLEERLARISNYFDNLPKLAVKSNQYSLVLPDKLPIPTKATLREYDADENKSPGHGSLVNWLNAYVCYSRVVVFQT
jgi:hypothetical protein